MSTGHLHLVRFKSLSRSQKRSIPFWVVTFLGVREAICLPSDQDSCLTGRSERNLRESRSCRRPAGGKQMSTGHLHLVRFKSLSRSQKRSIPFWVVTFLGVREAICLPSDQDSCLTGRSERNLRESRSCRRPAGGKQMSTGHLHLVRFKSLHRPNKRDRCMLI